MSVDCSDGRHVGTRTSGYRFMLPDLLAHVSRTSTLLPGDVLSLGSAGEALSLDAGQPLPAGTRVRASVEGLGSIEHEILDERDPAAQYGNADFFRPADVEN
jgi:2-keto-4-pentenoate hydratase/2-oxohepta-3-ene-1,7-dioic acid hydratase in catechol pathway